jgi:hypothetical protein
MRLEFDNIEELKAFALDSNLFPRKETPERSCRQRDIKDWADKDDILTSFVKVINEGSYIHTIKLVRELFGCSLYDAKQACDAYKSRMKWASRQDDEPF